MRFRVVSETPAGVVLKAYFGWRPGVWQRIAVTVEEGSIRVVSEATVPSTARAGRTSRPCASR